jgi:RNA polymerase sigma-70 factor (ECF subfamily)
MNRDDLLALYDAHARDLLGYLSRRTGDPQVALDLLGITFLAAFEHRQRCRAENDRERVAWLYRIAANNVVDHARRGAAEKRAIRRLGELRAPSADELARIEAFAESDGLHERVTAAFGGLSAQQRQAVWLRVVEERSYPEISRALRLSEPAVRARVSRGLGALRQAARPRRGEPPE